MTTRRLSLNVLEKMKLFDTRIDTYIDGDGFRSLMKWIPPFSACYALTATAAAVTPSNTVGDWFHPEDIQSNFVENTDYILVGPPVRQTSGTLIVGRWYIIKTFVAGDDFTNVGCPRNATGQSFCATGTTPTTWTNASVVELNGFGGFWVDMYLCSSNDSTMTSAGLECNNTANRRYYVSQPLRVPRVTQTIAHYRQYLSQRFNAGGFEGQPTGIWAGKGGLITDAHWFDLWIWTRINRWLLRGNTQGYTAGNNTYSAPKWHGNVRDIGLIDPTIMLGWGVSLTGGGSKFWEIPVSDFCGNRSELTEGVRLVDGIIYVAGKTVNPFTSFTDGASHASFVNTGLSITGCTSGQSVMSYRTEASLRVHGIPANTTTVGQGGFDGQGFYFDLTSERIIMRGGWSNEGVRGNGYLSCHINSTTQVATLGARAVLVP